MAPNAPRAGATQRSDAGDEAMTIKNYINLYTSWTLDVVA